MQFRYTVFFCRLARFMSLMQALVQCLDGYIPLVTRAWTQEAGMRTWAAKEVTLVASSGNSWPMMTLAMSFSTTGPSGRPVNGTAFTVSWDFWGLQDGPHWVTGILERHTRPGPH